MRLIDADAFLKEYCEPYPHIYQAMSSAFKHAQTVDAIPVEWLQAHITTIEQQRLLDEWAERKEE